MTFEIRITIDSATGELDIIYPLEANASMVVAIFDEIADRIVEKMYDKMEEKFPGVELNESMDPHFKALTLADLAQKEKPEAPPKRKKQNRSRITRKK